MNIELKRIKVAANMTQETTAFTAELHIDGVYAGDVRNDGHGGPDDYRPRYVQRLVDFNRNRFLIAEAEKFCLTLPPIVYQSEFEDEAFEMKSTLEHVIGKLLSDDLKNRDQKKLEKKMVDSLLIGVPNGAGYRYVKFKTPLAKMELIYLQAMVIKYKKAFRAGEVFLNTNLESLGVKI